MEKRRAWIKFQLFNLPVLCGRNLELVNVAMRKTISGETVII